MKDAITRDIVAGRLVDFQRENYLYIGGIMNGIALAGGTFVLLEIAVAMPSAWPRLVLWAVSVLAVGVSYVTWARGLLLTNARGNLLDYTLPFAMGMTKFLLFGVLSTALLSDESSVHLWKMWFFVFGLNALGAALLINNRLVNTKVDDYEMPLQAIASDYKGWMRTDRRGALRAGVSACLFGTIALIAGWPVWAHAVAAALFAILLARVVRKAEQQRQLIVQAVFPE